MRDSAALQSAQFLERALRKRGFDDVQMIVGDVPRELCDLNRDQCWNTPFRQHIRQALKPGAYVIDVHSFQPRRSFRKSDPEGKGWDFVILDNSPVSRTPPARLLAIDRQVQEDIDPLRAGLLRGGLQNSIVREVLGKGYDAILLEFPEPSATTDMSTNETIANSVAKALVSGKK